MELNVKNLQKLIEKDLPKVIQPQINKMVAAEIEKQRNEIAAEIEEELEEQESLLGRNCHPLQRKACHLEARKGFILEFRRKGYLSPKFYKSKDWLLISYRMRMKRQ